MKILLSNDDGYLAPGLVHLRRALSSRARVTVIAPDRNRSGTGSALTLDRPLRVVRAGDGVFHVDGTPLDCVHLAITGLFTETWDVVLSGINAGTNLGDGVWYSGTVSAAMEARFLGVPAMAVSLASEEPSHFETAARAVHLLLDRIRDDALPDNTILNVNVPDIPWPAVRGFEATRLGCRGRPMDMVTETDPDGHAVYRIGPPGPERDAGPGTDFFAIKCHRITVTPLQIDQTRHAALGPVAGWIDRIPWKYTSSG